MAVVNVSSHAYPRTQPSQARATSAFCFFTDVTARRASSSPTRESSARSSSTVHSSSGLATVRG